MFKCCHVSSPRCKLFRAFRGTRSISELVGRPGFSPVAEGRITHCLGFQKGKVVPVGYSEYSEIACHSIKDDK